MQAVVQNFGDGKTLPFTPCKKGYQPQQQGATRMYACPKHHVQRKKRVEKEGWREGEVDLSIFWKNDGVVVKKEEESMSEERPGVVVSKTLESEGKKRRTE